MKTIYSITTEEIRETHVEQRAGNIAIVLGPSGSGETIFALTGLIPPASLSDDKKSKQERQLEKRYARAHPSPGLLF